ncbi:MAG: hypothetical protein AAF497_06330, partial [Planctomycetota bacterium]
QPTRRRIQFSLRTYLVATIVLGVAAAIVVRRINSNHVPNEWIPVSKGPAKLKELLVGREQMHGDLRRVPDCTHFAPGEFGYYWRLPASSKNVAWHIDSYWLKPAKHTDSYVQKMIEGLPWEWRIGPAENLTWYTNGLGDDGNVGSFFILGVDEQNDRLYFFHLSWDYAP